MLTAVIPNQARAFQYGNGGNAKFQLKALAVESHIAFQTLEYNCKMGDPALSVVGWNGVEFQLESSRNAMVEINAENNCQVHTVI